MSQKSRGSTDLHKRLPPSFGEDVKRVRQARGLTQKHLGTGAGFSEGHVSRVEAGLVVPSQRFAEGCDKTFGTGDLFATALRRLVDGEHPAWFAPHIDAEREASVIHDYSIAFITGLLQTEDYARSVLEQGMLLLPHEEVAAQVRSRMRRREIWERPNPPRAWVILHEACLRAQVGSPRVMADQISCINGGVAAAPDADDSGAAVLGSGHSHQHALHCPGDAREFTGAVCGRSSRRTPLRSRRRSQQCAADH